MGLTCGVAAAEEEQGVRDHHHHMQGPHFCGYLPRSPPGSAGTMPPLRPPRGRGDWLTVQDDPDPGTQHPPHRLSLPCFRHSPGAGRLLYRSAAGAPDGLRTLEEWQWGSGLGSCLSPLLSLSHSMGFSSLPTAHTSLLENRPLSSPFLDPPSPDPPSPAPLLPLPLRMPAPPCSSCALCHWLRCTMSWYCWATSGGTGRRACLRARIWRVQRGL